MSARPGYDGDDIGRVPSSQRTNLKVIEETLFRQALKVSRLGPRNVVTIHNAIPDGLHHAAEFSRKILPNQIDRVLQDEQEAPTI